MGPLIDSELERVDRKHAQLTQLSADLVEALGLYHTLMREPQFPIVNKLPYGYPSSSQQMVSKIQFCSMFSLMFIKLASMRFDITILILCFPLSE